MSVCCFMSRIPRRKRRYISCLSSFRRPMILTVMEDNVYVADFVMATIIPDEADADMDDENDAPAPSNGHAPQPSNAPRASNAQSTAPRTRAAAPAATASRIQGQAAAAPNANGNRATNGASAARPSGAVQATVSQGNFGASARNSHGELSSANHPSPLLH